MFQEIPSITASSTFGGIIYGLQLQNNLSSSPSKLTVDIINENGNYTINSNNLNSAYQVQFGNFTFNGILWSYNINHNVDSKTLQLEIIDKSVILDRYYVLLWKRGLFNDFGSSIIKYKNFDFSDETVTVPIMEGDQIKFRERNLGSARIARTARKSSGSSGNVLYLGTEQFPDSNCDIPTTDYNFTELKQVVNKIINIKATDKNSFYRSTHEGTLRSVLQAWCADFGYDFYWDFSSTTNNIVFFDVSEGITINLPNRNDKELISYSEKATLEGTFRQYGVSYSARPRKELTTRSTQAQISSTNPQNPYPLSWYMTKAGYSQAITEEGTSRWGANRSKSEFIACALLGYVNKSLRNLYCFQNNWWEVLGYKLKDSKIAPKNQIIGFLLSTGGYETSIETMEQLDGKELPSFRFYFINHDEGAETTWHDIEAEMLGNIGRHYRVPGVSRSFFYCNANFTATVDISVSPEGSYVEPKTSDFSGRYILDRGGTISHDSSAAQEILKINENIDKINVCAPIHVELKESGLLDNLIEAGILSEEEGLKFNTLLIYPTDDFVSKQLGFRANNITGNNQQESTVQDVVSSGGVEPSCTALDNTLEASNCKSAEEEARAIVLSRVTGKTAGSFQFATGLLSRGANGVSVSVKGVTERIYAPSDSQYQFVVTTDINLEKIVRTSQNFSLFSHNGSGGRANDVQEIRVAFDNMTDSELDEWGVTRRNLVTASNVDGSDKQISKTFVFAGNIPGGLPLRPSDGLSSLDISLSSDGFKTTVSYITRPPQPVKLEAILRKTQSQFKRVGY